MPLLNWLKANLEAIISFLKEHAIEISVKKKTTQEIARTIKISNIFLVFAIALAVALIYGALKFF